MVSLLVALLVPRVGKLAAYAILGAVLAAAVAAPFVYTYRAGYSAATEYCEAKARLAAAIAQKAADETADALRKETLEAEDNDAQRERRDEEAAPAVAAAIERGASPLQCIDADSMRLIAQTDAGQSNVSTAGLARARAKGSR